MIRNRYISFLLRACGCRFFEICKIYSGLCQIQIPAVSLNVTPYNAGELQHVQDILPLHLK